MNDDEDDYMKDGVFQMPDRPFSFGPEDDDDDAFAHDATEGAVVERIVVDGTNLYVLSVPIEPELPPSLSVSEREVVKLVLSGATNAEIAAARGAAVQTVANQLRTAFQKIGVNSRAELAARLYGSPEE